MKMLLKPKKITLSYLLAISSVTLAKAQKLPNVQQASLRAPTNIKIDGKANEWEGNFQAHNSATAISYTLSNDDNYLYLAVQTADQTAISKIMGGGIMFLIQPSGKKNDENSMVVNFPVYGKGYYPSFSFSRQPVSTITVNQRSADSVTLADNLVMNKNAKSIRTVGLKNVDSLISIYNDDGIKVAQLFGTSKLYTCEMAISLKKLGFSINNPQSFSYHILLNSGPNKNNGMDLKITPPPNASSAMLDAMERMKSVNSNMNAIWHSTTDFWGEYMLVK